MLVLAHAGHWVGQLVYVVPVVLVVAVIGWGRYKDGRAGRNRDEEDSYMEPSLDDIMDGRA